MLFFSLVTKLRASKLAASIATLQAQVCHTIEFRILRKSLDYLLVRVAKVRLGSIVTGLYSPTG